VRELERRRDELNAQIERIIASGTVETMSAGEVRDRFEEAVRTARGLQGDFRAVEQNFRLITQQLQERQFDPAATRGDLAGFVLERDRALTESEQGQSFAAFLRFLLSERSQQEFQRLLVQIQEMPALRSDLQESPVLRQLLKRLLAESAKVVRTNHRLAEQLRRALDWHNLQERRRVAEQIQEIKALAQQLRGRLSPETPLVELPMRPHLNAPMERPLWRQRVELYLRGRIEDHVERPASALDLADLLALDLARLREQVAAALREREQVTLTELLDTHPPENGVFDLIGYLALATKSRRHRVDDGAVMRFVLPETRERKRQEVEFPQIYFVR
jgi:hypothetical protein